jgi:peptide chain release factor subunit 1
MATLTPKIQKARFGLLRKLSEMDPKGKVLSLYIDLDPAEFAIPSAIKTQVNSLLNEAEQLVERLDHHSKKALGQDIELVREFLLEDSDWSSEARSVAIFASSESALFDVVKLSKPLERGAFVEDGPHVLPMREAVSEDKWCVALVDRRTSRIFVGSPLKLNEYDEVEEDVPGQHDQGGWSQARYARWVEEEVEDHLKNVSDRLLRLHKSRHFDYLVIGSSDELWPRIAQKLHSYVAEDLIGRIEADVQNASIEDLRDKLKNLAALQEQEHEQWLLDELRKRLAHDSRAASGLAQVLESLNEARVHALLVAEGFDAAGTLCPKCGFLSEDAEECPVDGQAMEPAVSIIEKAFERAEEISAEWTVVRNPDALTPMGSVAALLRF